jgi:hypothetical protein
MSGVEKSEAEQKVPDEIDDGSEDKPKAPAAKEEDADKED